MSIENDEINDLQEACSLLTKTQVQLEDCYGPASYKLMHARSYLEKEYLHPIINELLADPEAK